jgi:hypothetical protein
MVDDGNGIPGHLSKSEVPIGCLGLAMATPVHYQYTVFCTQALDQGCENRVIVRKTR